MAKPQQQPNPARTAEQIRDAKLSKPEDRLAFGLWLWLVGRLKEAAEIWPLYFKADTGQFQGNAASNNHRAMAGVLALLFGVPAARAYWIKRLAQEKETQMGLGEVRSNKYAHWSLGSVALVWLWAVEHDDGELRDLAASVYAGTVASWALGSTKHPSQRTAGKWNGCYASGPGVRSDPGHLDGDARAWVLQTEIYGGGNLKDAYRGNAQKRAAGWAKQGILGLEERKLASELWWLTAIERARKAGLRIPAEVANACRAMMASDFDRGALPLEVLVKAVGRCYWTFRFLIYPDGTRVSWLEGDNHERNIFADRIDRDGSLQLAFPYPEAIAKASRGGKCHLVDGKVIAESPYGRGVVELPEGEPVLSLIYDGGGLREVVA